MALCELRYFSNALQKQTGAFVILPEVGKPPYPTLYLLHGLSDDHTIWQRRTSIERYVGNLPLIVVMPDGGRGFYADAFEGYAYQSALAVELPERIDRTFPTLASREGRCVAGLSMGGYGAFRFALTFPDQYAAAVSHSGALGWGHSLEGRNGLPPSAEFQRILGPDFVGGPNDLFALVENADKATLPALRFDCGTEDFLIEHNRDFQKHLTTLGISHEYAEHPGSHEWGYWDRYIQDSLAFFAQHLDLSVPQPETK
jgi:putative tributyrin esterase